MKLDLETVEDAVQLKYRVPASIKAELDRLAEECRKKKVSFTAALTVGLREVAKSLKRELKAKAEPRTEPKIEPKSGATVTPETYPNGGSK